VARLCGAAESLRGTLQAPPRLAVRAFYERALAAARAELGEDAFRAAWAEGRAMPPERAVAYALEETAQA
jgi:hypothetical protein